MTTIRWSGRLDYHVLRDYFAHEFYRQNLSIVDAADKGAAIAMLFLHASDEVADELRLDAVARFATTLRNVLDVLEAELFSEQELVAAEQQLAAQFADVKA